MARGAIHQRNGSGNFVWAAAEARPIAVFFRFFSRVEEYDIAA
jgi:hypothetical protein